MIDKEVRMAHGKICYLEIPANKAEEAAEFYASIFGWKVRTRGDGNLAFDDPGGVSGTWVKETDRTPDERTRVYIMVDSIADALERIREAGGRVLTPRTDIGEKMGAFAALRTRLAMNSVFTKSRVSRPSGRPVITPTAIFFAAARTCRSEMR
jgi:predicted enzyme related to lactoylglutathione lyase